MYTWYFLRFCKIYKIYAGVIELLGAYDFITVNIPAFFFALLWDRISWQDVYRNHLLEQSPLDHIITSPLLDNSITTTHSHRHFKESPCDYHRTRRTCYIHYLHSAMNPGILVTRWGVQQNADESRWCVTTHTKGNYPQQRLSKHTMKCNCILASPPTGILCLVANSLDTVLLELSTITSESSLRRL
jgi:hypothetical protein